MCEQVIGSRVFCQYCVACALLWVKEWQFYVVVNYGRWWTRACRSDGSQVCKDLLRWLCLEETGYLHFYNSNSNNNFNTDMCEIIMEDFRISHRSTPKPRSRKIWLSLEPCPQRQSTGQGHSGQDRWPCQSSWMSNAGDTQSRILYKKVNWTGRMPWITVDGGSW